MEELKIYISAFLFTALAALKMAFPAAAEQLRDMTVKLLSSDRSCIEVIETMGKKLSENGVGKELIEVFIPSDEGKKCETSKMNCKPENAGEVNDGSNDNMDSEAKTKE